MSDRPTPRWWNAFAWLFLGALFLKELVMSVVAVLRAVLSRELSVKPAIIAVPLTIRSDAGITILADMISLTPGTTSLHVSEDRRTLYVHALDGSDPDGLIRSIKDGFERATMRVLP
jgi:multicomponent Na+:H+ antiporter subunit E